MLPHYQSPQIASGLFLCKEACGLFAAVAREAVTCDTFKRSKSCRLARRIRGLSAAEHRAWLQGQAPGAALLGRLMAPRFAGPAGSQRGMPNVRLWGPAAKSGSRL